MQTNLIKALRAVVPKNKQNLYIGKVISVNPLQITVAGVQVSNIYISSGINYSAGDEVIVALVENDEQQDLVVLNVVSMEESS